MNRKLYSIMLALLISFMGFVCKASVDFDDIEGTIGGSPATVTFRMDHTRNTITGHFRMKSPKAPVKGKVTLSGTYKQVKDPEMPHYPLFTAKMTARATDGKVCGNWNVEIDTRMGTMEGKCTIGDKTYKVLFDSLE